MVETADAVIVGGGILGVSTAYHLSKLGFGNVVLLEKQTLASGSTGRSAAVVRSFYSNKVCIQLAKRAIHMFENFHEELGEDVEFRQIGYMVITNDASTVQRVVELQHQLGLTWSRVLSREEIKELLPHMRVDDVAAAGYEPRSGYADPHLTTMALAQKGREHGLQVYQKCEVASINGANGKLESVTTSRGKISTRVVVNAGGPWANRAHGFEAVPLPLRLSREQDCVMIAPEVFRKNPVVSDAIRHIYCRPESGGKLLAGVGYPKEEEPCDPDRFNERADMNFIEQVTEKLLYRFPDIKDARFINGWAGLYTITPDWHPIVGKAPGIEGYYLAVGGSGHSFKIGPPIGEALAQLIACGKSEIDISPLRYERFQTNETFGSVWGEGNRA